MGYIVVRRGGEYEGIRNGIPKFGLRIWSCNYESVCLDGYVTSGQLIFKRPTPFAPLSYTPHSLTQCVCPYRKSCNVADLICRPQANRPKARENNIKSPIDCQLDIKAQLALKPSTHTKTHPTNQTTQKPLNMFAKIMVSAKASYSRSGIHFNPLISIAARCSLRCRRSGWSAALRRCTCSTGRRRRDCALCLQLQCTSH